VRGLAHAAREEQHHLLALQQLEDVAGRDRHGPELGKHAGLGSGAAAAGSHRFLAPEGTGVGEAADVDALLHDELPHDGAQVQAEQLMVAHEKHRPPAQGLRRRHAVEPEAAGAVGAGAAEDGREDRGDALHALGGLLDVLERGGLEAGDVVSGRLVQGRGPEQRHEVSAGVGQGLVPRALQDLHLEAALAAAGLEQGPQALGLLLRGEEPVLA